MDVAVPAVRHGPRGAVRVGEVSWLILLCGSLGGVGVAVKRGVSVAWHGRARDSSAGLPTTRPQRSTP